MPKCLKCGGELSQRRICRRHGPMPPSKVTKLNELMRETARLRAIRDQRAEGLRT